MSENETTSTTDYSGIVGKEGNRPLKLFPTLWSKASWKVTLFFTPKTIRIFLETDLQNELIHFRAKLSECSSDT